MKFTYGSLFGYIIDSKHNNMGDYIPFLLLSA